MKPALATASSVFMVVLAGAAAFGFNSYVLQPTETPAAPHLQAQPAVPADPALVIGAPSGTVVAQDVLAAPSSAAPVPENTSPAAPSDAVLSNTAPAATSPAMTTYALGAVGSVDVRQTASGVEIVSVSSTWKHASQRVPGGVAVRFEDGGRVIQFTASLQAGRIATAVQNLTVVTAVPRPVESDDDRDDDRDDDHNEDPERGEREEEDD